MNLLFSLLIGIFCNFFSTPHDVLEDYERYIIMEAPCKSSFNALHKYKEKVILTKVFRAEFENAFEMVNAEADLIVDFEAALEKLHPNSSNQIKDIMVYMLDTKKEAKELYNRKKKYFKTLEIGVLEMKVK